MVTLQHVSPNADTFGEFQGNGLVNSPGRVSDFEHGSSTLVPIRRMSVGDLQSAATKVTKGLKKGENMKNVYRGICRAIL